MWREEGEEVETRCARTPRRRRRRRRTKADADAEVIRPFEMRARGECVGKVWSGNGETGGEGEVETPEETPEVRIAAEGARRAFADAADADAENDGEDGRRCGAKSTRDVHSGQHQGGGEDEKDAEDGASALGGDAFASSTRQRRDGAETSSDVKPLLRAHCADHWPYRVVTRSHPSVSITAHVVIRPNASASPSCRETRRRLWIFASPRAVRGESVPFRFELVARLLLHQRHVVQSNL